MGILDTIYSKTVTKTGRFDRVNETKIAVAGAIDEYHSLGFFEKDIQRGVLTMGVRQLGKVDLSSLIPNLRRVMGVFTESDQKIEKISPLDLSCPGYYMMGKTLHLNPSNLQSQIVIAYCQTPEPEDSWIAMEYEDAVATLAAAKVANIVGNRALASALYLEVGGLVPVRSGYKHKIMMENPSYEPDL
jgi:hypothetical protein